MTSLGHALILALLTAAPLPEALDDPALIEPTAASLTPSTLAIALQTRQQHLAQAGDLALAADTLKVAPVAERLGLSAQRTALESASFALLDPSLHAALLASAPSPEDLASVLHSSQQLLDDAGIVAVLSGRIKAPYSTHRKMLRTGRSADQLFDRLALRLRVDTVKQCYAARELLHQTFTPVKGEQDDYIAQPRPSGYASLHTAVLTEVGPVEFQIRTHAMHHEAEHGAAAHWRYKLS